MSKVILYMPELEGDEQLLIASLMKEMTETQAEQFARVYRERRRDPGITLVLALVGFLGIAGVHRFVLNQIVIGLLYLFTAGLCFIGTVVDMVNYKSLTFGYNKKQALEVATLIRGAFPLDTPPDQLSA